MTRYLPLLLTFPDFSPYKLIVVPALYAASDDLLERLNRFVEDEGHVVYTFNSGFSNEYVKVRSSSQPGIIHKACGVTYSQFTRPEKVSLKGERNCYPVKTLAKTRCWN